MKRTLPSDLPDLTGGTSEIFKAFGIEYISFGYGSMYKVSGLTANCVTGEYVGTSTNNLFEEANNHLIYNNGNMWPTCHIISFPDYTNIKTRFGYLSDDGLCYETTITVGSCEVTEKKISDGGRAHTITRTLPDKITIEDISASKWKACKKLYIPCVRKYETGGIWFIYTKNELLAQLKKTHPYAVSYLYDESEPDPRTKTWFDLRIIAQAPWLEILKKANYCFVDRFAVNGYINSTDVSVLNSLCKTGTSPDTIFKIPRTIYRQCQNKNVTPDKIKSIADLNDTCELAYEDVADLLSDTPHIKPWFLDEIKKTLAQVNEGLERPLFTYKSLLKYLERLDMYEAIDDTGVALNIIRDYVETCKQLNITPRFDTDSIKREHDVAARNLRVYLQEQEEKRKKEMENMQKDAKLKVVDEMEAAYTISSRYNYSERVFSIKAIRNMDELLDEANQQSNCVASYAPQIKSGRTMIFSLRETEHPEKSLITVQLDPISMKIVQAYLSHNRSIKSMAQKAFLERWLTHIKNIDITEAA